MNDEAIQLEQMDALGVVLAQVRDLDLDGWMEPDVSQSDVWPYTVACWTRGNLVYRIEFEWGSQVFKYGVHSLSSHGFTYDTPTLLDGAEGAAFKDHFRASWARMREEEE